ncbi:MAG: isoaspartyl peptidase/L-asparaginase [Nannocystaceae bacterium]
MSTVASTPPIIVVHGGAGTVSEPLRGLVVAGVNLAAHRAQSLLLAGGAAEDAAIAAVRILEDDPAFNAGRGACLNFDGDIELDAGIMRSQDGRSGAVAAIRDVRDPILVAQAVMTATRHCLLAGPSAEAFARAQGVGAFGREEVETPKARARWVDARAGATAIDNRADTVGAVALDRAGFLCAAGSTGGILLKLPGRVGDTPIVGAGFYADARLGACCCTGVGEAIMGRVLAYEVLRRADEAPEKAQAIADDLCREVSVAHYGAAIGLILCRPDGHVAVAHCSDHMSWALAIGDGPVASGLARGAPR